MQRGARPEYSSHPGNKKTGIKIVARKCQRQMELDHYRNTKCEILQLIQYTPRLPSFFFQWVNTIHQWSRQQPLKPHYESDIIPVL